MQIGRWAGVWTLAMVWGVGSLASADVRLPALIGDNMVLQQGRPARLWGWADPGETVRASIAGLSAETVATPEGTFRLAVGPLPVGGPYTLEITGKNVLRITNVLVGEVWVASGQSNMEFPLSRARNADEEIAKAAFPQIRLFTVAKATSTTPKDDVSGGWVECGPDTASTFSAVAYFFGRKLAQELHVPIGLVHTSWGGTPAEAWTSREALTAEPSLRPMVDELDRLLADPSVAEKYARELKAWREKNLVQDPGNVGEGQGFARTDFDDAGWEKVTLPASIERLGHQIDGVVWFRHTVEVPAAWAGKDLTLRLGAIDDCDTTYFNGEKVGETTCDTPSSYTLLRAYKIPGGLVKAGANVVAVRVFDSGGDGGFMGPADQMRVAPDGPVGPISLAGSWQLRVEAAEGPVTPDWGSQPRRADSENGPTTLFNAMVAPLTPMSIRGVIWYQGESNADRAVQYRTLFPTLIRDWRAHFGLGDFPFYFVQLANYMARAAEPGPSDWAMLREAQLMTLRLPNTGMAVTIDIGAADDIHPTDKQDVGLRLALWALAKTYDRSVVFSGPLYRSHELYGHEISIGFDHADGLAARGGPPVGFAIAGADHKFVWADARIEGEHVIVSSPKVPTPVAVRYGWADNPEVNLYNGAGLPASPFRTDDWD